MSIPTKTRSLLAIAPLQPIRLPSPSAAQYIGVAPQTLANWRALGKGPRYRRDGRLHSRVFYKVADLNTWIDDDPDTDGGAA